MQDDKSDGSIVKQIESEASGETDIFCDGGSQEKNHWGESGGISQRQQEQPEKKRVGDRRHPAQQGPEENCGQEENRQDDTRFDDDTDPLIVQEERVGHCKKRRTSPREKTPNESEEKSDSEKRCSRKLDPVESEEKDPLEEAKSLIESLREIEKFPYKNEDVIVALCDNDVKKDDFCHHEWRMPRNKKKRYTCFSCLVPLIGKYCLPKQLGKELEEEKNITERMDRIEYTLIRISDRIEKLAQRGGICKKHSQKSVKTSCPINSEKCLQVDMSESEMIQAEQLESEPNICDVCPEKEKSISEPQFKEDKMMNCEDKDEKDKLSDTSDDYSVAKISENFAKELCGINEKSLITNWSSEDADISSQSDGRSNRYSGKSRTSVSEEYTEDSSISTGKGEPDQTYTVGKDDKVNAKTAPHSDDYEPYLIKKPDGIPRSVQKKLAMSYAMEHDKKNCQQ